MQLRKLELSQAIEKSRILQDGLQALAQEHHDLEQISRFSSHSGSFYDAKTEASFTDNPSPEVEQTRIHIYVAISFLITWIVDPAAQKSRILEEKK